MLPSYGHVKVLRNGFRRQRAGTATSLFFAPLPLFFPHFLVFFLFAYVVAYVVSFQYELIQALSLYVVLFLCLNKRWICFLLNTFLFCSNYFVNGVLHVYFPLMTLRAENLKIESY